MVLMCVFGFTPPPVVATPWDPGQQRNRPLTAPELAVMRGRVRDAAWAAGDHATYRRASTWDTSDPGTALMIFAAYQALTAGAEPMARQVEPGADTAPISAAASYVDPGSAPTYYDSSPSSFSSSSWGDSSSSSSSSDSGSSDSGSSSSSSD